MDAIPAMEPLMFDTAPLPAAWMIDARRRDSAAPTLGKHPTLEAPTLETMYEDLRRRETAILTETDSGYAEPW